MHVANSTCLRGIRDRIQNGLLATGITASRSGSVRTPFRIGARVWFCLVALAVPAAAQWRTGYFIQAEAAGQTAATIPWSKYTHIIHSALRPTYTNGICGLDSNSGLLSATNITDFVNAAHASDVKAIVGIREDDTREAITACTAPQNIAQFVELIRSFVANSGYDGVDLDWESGIIAPQYQDLIRRLRTAMPTATLSVAVGIAERFMTAAVQDDLDQINIRAYNLDSQDLTGSAIHYSWYHSPTLQGASTEDQAMDILSWSYVYAGNASSKLGLAVPFYGRIRKGCLNDTGTNGVTDPNQAWVGRAEISSVLYRDLVNSTYWNAGTRVWDDSRKSQYIQYRDGGCANDAFIPYLGPEQLQEVASLIKANKLGGIATYSLPYEYMATQDGDARYPLSTAIDDAIRATVSSDSVISKRSALAAIPSSALANRAAMDAPPTPTAPSITSPLPTALTGAAYSQTVTAAGTAPITWSVTGGALPAGLTLGSSTGIIGGMPTAQGVFTLTVTASNAVGSNSQQLSLTVNAVPLIVTTSPLPSAMTGTAYSLTLAATGTTPMTWTVTGGALPSGLTLGTSTGTISGTPSAVGVFTPTVSATNALGSNSQQLSITVNAPTPPSIGTTSPLPTGLTGTVYAQTLTATGATPMTWTVTSGALPSGLTLGSSTGTISGTPTALGVFTPTVTATNAGGANSKQLSLTVNAPPTPPSIVTTSPLPAALTGAAYSQTLSATGTTPMTWTVTGGALPSGLTLGSSTGTISGTPAVMGTVAFTVTVTNAVGSSSKPLSMAVNAAPSITTVSPLPAGQTGLPYSTALSASGSAPITWAVTGGSLPAGLSLNASTGVISGTATAQSVSNFTVTATNAVGHSSAALSLTVNTPVKISLTPSAVSLLPSQQQTFTATVSGTSNTGVTWSISPSVGSLVSSGTKAIYVAPATVPSTQTVTITAASLANPSVAAATVITLPQTISVSLSPSSASLSPSGTQQFSVAVLGTGNGSVNWSISPAVGTISPAGLYTAPATMSLPETVTITAASVSNPNTTASASITIVTPAGATYYLAPAAGGGNDANNGRSPSAPWLSPNHALNCGDVILAAPSAAYSAGNFAQSKWGTVTCPAGNNVAWLKCVTFDSCKIGGLANLQNGMEITKSYWGVQGWEVDGNPSSGMCFFTGWHNIRNIIYANNVAVGCGLSGIEAGNYELAGPDYIAFVGNIAYGNSGGTQSCGSGLNIYSPVAQDALSGTHIYVAGNFSWNNVNGPRCGGTPSTDGEGLIFDTFDGRQTIGLSPYTQQAVADNNLLWANGGRGITVTNNLLGASNTAHIYLRNNTAWGNNTDLGQSTVCECVLGEITVVNANNETIEKNIAVTNSTKGAQGAPLYAFWVTTPTSAVYLSQDIAYSDSGTYIAKYDPAGVFNYSPSDLMKAKPIFANPTNPGAPNCTSAAGVPDCMASAIANFTPTNPAAKAYGYQKPGDAQVYDPLFPKWLCNVNLPTGLVTMGCLQAPPVTGSVAATETNAPMVQFDAVRR